MLWLMYVLVQSYSSNVNLNVNVVPRISVHDQWQRWMMAL